MPIHLPSFHRLPGRNLLGPTHTGYRNHLRPRHLRLIERSPPTTFSADWVGPHSPTFVLHKHHMQHLHKCPARTDLRGLQQRQRRHMPGCGLNGDESNPTRGASVCLLRRGRQHSGCVGRHLQKQMLLLRLPRGVHDDSND